MNQRQYLLKGTFLLTAAGLLTRAAGFFYKIFLSRAIGAKEIGLFQLTMPVFGLCIAAACGGIQSAVSRFTAGYYARGDKKEAARTLLGALLLSGTVSLLGALFLYQNSFWISEHFLLEKNCAAVLQILSFSLPFCAVHCCLNGFFIGRKAIIPSAVSQLLEQLVRILSVFLFYQASLQSGRTMDASVMALGQLAGELASSLYCTCCLLYKCGERSGFNQRSFSAGPAAIAASIRKLLPVSLPLGANRMLLCVLQGIEASMLPLQLRIFGLDSHKALTIYGTLTGMALPLILFPTAITGSLGTLLLPAVSEAYALQEGKRISSVADASLRGGLLLGSFCLSGFLLFGDAAGSTLFHSTLAGIYIRRLALLCPFLYINTALSNILHGIGKSTAAFLLNTASFAIRLCAVFLLVPASGIDGYLAGMIASQVFITIGTLLLLRRFHSLTVSIADAALGPLLLSLLSGSVIFALRTCIPFLRTETLPGLFFSVLLYCFLFALPAFFLMTNSVTGKKYGSGCTLLNKNHFDISKRPRNHR